MNRNFSELIQRTQDTLITFLRIEVDLADTFSKILKNSRNPEHCAKLQGNIGAVVRTIRLFSDRVNDPAIRGELSRQANRLARESFGLSPSCCGSLASLWLSAWPGHRGVGLSALRPAIPPGPTNVPVWLGLNGRGHAKHLVNPSKS